MGAEARIRNHMPEITRLSRGPPGVSMAISEKPISVLPLVYLL